MTDSQAVNLAIDASSVLDNPAYTEAMERLRAQVVEEWKACPIRDREGQLLYLQIAKLADKFEGMLRGYIEGGKLAQHRIDIDAARSDSTVRRWVRRVAA